LNAQGYVSLQDGQETSIPYVYAVGDVSDPLYKQAISAAGEGARAALSLQSKLTDAAQLVAAYQQALNRPVVLQHKVVEITSLEQFHRELKNDGMPVLVDFYAKWCAPCKRIAPRLDSCAAQLAGKVKFLKVDVDLLGELTHNYQIQSMPTVLYFDEAGTVIERKVGTAEINALLAQLESE
jgi:thioredoxin